MAEANNNFNKNDVLKKIRCKYLKIKIFNNLEQKKLLDLIHYNKRYQKLMIKRL